MPKKSDNRLSSDYRKNSPYRRNRHFSPKRRKRRETSPARRHRRRSSSGSEVSIKNGPVYYRKSSRNRDQYGSPPGSLRGYQNGKKSYVCQNKSILTAKKDIIKTKYHEAKSGSEFKAKIMYRRSPDRNNRNRAPLSDDRVPARGRGRSKHGLKSPERSSTPIRGDTPVRKVSGNFPKLLPGGELRPHLGTPLTTISCRVNICLTWHFLLGGYLLL